MKPRPFSKWITVLKCFGSFDLNLFLQVCEDHKNEPRETKNDNMQMETNVISVASTEQLCT